MFFFYLHGHVKCPLCYTPNVEHPLQIFVDSNWESCYSCSGAVFMFHGCPVHWFSKSQRSVALSSAEAEYFGAMMAAQDGVFVHKILFNFSMLKIRPTVVFCNSKSAVALALDPVAFKNTKHILRAAYFLHELVDREVFIVRHVAGSLMIADLLTKAVARSIFVSLSDIVLHYPMNGLKLLS